MPPPAWAVTGLDGPFVGDFVAGAPVLVRPRPGRPAQALVTANGRTVLAAIGRSGIRTLKREGDGATPRARLEPLAALVAGPLRPRGLPWRRVRSGDGWCDDAADFAYNRATRLPHATSHEEMARPDGLYDAVVVTDHNARPRVRGAGSAIFLHLARPGLSPTAGCLAFPRALWQRGGVPLGPYLVGVDPRPRHRKRKR